MRLLDIKEIQSMQLVLMKKIHVFLQENNIRYYLLAGSALGAVRHNGFIPWDDDIDIGMPRKDYEKFIKLSNAFEGYEIENFHNSNHCDYLLTRIYIPNTYVDNKIISKTNLNKKLYFDVFPLDNVPKNEKERIKFEKKIYSKKLLIARIDVRDNGNSKIVMLAKRIVSFILKPFRNRILKNVDKLMRKYEDETTSLICSLSSQYSFKKQVMPKSFYGTPTIHAFEDSEFYIPEKVEDYLATLYGDNYMEVPPVDKRRPIPIVYYIDEENN